MNTFRPRSSKQIVIYCSCSFRAKAKSVFNKRVTPKRRPCRLQTLQTVQTMQTEYFYLTFDSLSSVLQLQNSVKYVMMFVIYPQTTQTSTSEVVDSIDFEWEIPFTDPKCTKIKRTIEPCIPDAHCVNF